MAKNVNVVEKEAELTDVLFETVAKTLEWENAEVVKTVKGSELEYTVAKHPVGLLNCKSGLFFHE